MVGALLPTDSKGGGGGGSGWCIAADMGGAGEALGGGAGGAATCCWVFGLLSPPSLSPPMLELVLNLGLG